MQAYPQPQPPAQNITPQQNMTPQKPWWLIYGLGFGLGVIIFNFIYYYGIDALLRPLESSTLGVIVSILLVPFVYLIFFSACLVAGILAARKTHRAGSATLAGLLVGVCFFLSELVIYYISPQGANYRAMTGSFLWINFWRINFPAACLGVYVGFISGLVGRTTERSRRIIGIFYVIGVILVSTAFTLFMNALVFYPSRIGNFAFYFLWFDAIWALILLVLGGICGMTAWIMTLIQYAKAQSWGAFTLTFFFSGIMVLVYLIVGVTPAQPAQYVVLQPGGYAPAYPPMQPAQVQPSQPDAISILQQRFACGEINEETYRQMLATLTNQPANPPQQ